jgi:hypothetical protein
MLPRWLVSTPIQLYAHPATPKSTPLGVDYVSLMHALGIWLRCMPPPEPYLKKVQRPPMVVGGGHIEDVCKIEKMPGWSGYPATSPGQLKNREGMAPLPAPVVRRAGL